MATIQDRETFGRARLSFAERGGHRRVRLAARTLRERRHRPRRVAGVPVAARHLRAAADRRRADDAHQDSSGNPRSEQLDALADVAERYSRGFGHITTRQNIQLHFVKLHDAEPAMRELAAAGMTTREACGNSVRNITACPYAGVAEGRSLRRDALRRGADALPAAASAELRRCRASSRSPSRGAPRITSGRRSTTSAGRARRDSRRPRRPRVQGHRRRRHRDDDEGREPAARVPACRRDVRLRGSDHPRLPSARRLQAQAEEPAEVSGQVARLGRVPHASTSASAPSS